MKTDNQQMLSNDEFIILLKNGYVPYGDAEEDGSGRNALQSKEGDTFIYDYEPRAKAVTHPNGEPTLLTVTQQNWSNPAPDVAVHDFVSRQTANSEFSHWVFSDEVLVERVQARFHEQRPGYRDGVIIVPIDANGVYCPIRKLRNNDTLIVEYKPRRDGESPRRHEYLDGVNKAAACHVEVVLYHRDVLYESGEQAYGRWNIISVNAGVDLEDLNAPMKPETLLHNHFGSDGGTDTQMDAEAFVKELERSFNYWKTRALCRPTK